MATIKSNTDLEQSKKLAEILPLDSADMWWLYVTSQGKHIAMMYEEPDPHYLARMESYGIKNAAIPCWSLAALFQILPLSIYDELDSCDYELEINMIDKMPRYVRLGDVYHSQFPYDFEKDTLLDNIVESIIWLNDNNYFEL